MITSNEYDKLCALTDELRNSQSELEASTTPEERRTAARRYVEAENAWEAFALSLVVPKSV